jgi:hypothetical protein
VTAKKQREECETCEGWGTITCQDCDGQGYLEIEPIQLTCQAIWFDMTTWPFEERRCDHELRPWSRNGLCDDHRRQLYWQHERPPVPLAVPA